MPDFQIEVLTEAPVTGVVHTGGEPDLEIELGSVVVSGQVTEVETAEVSLPENVNLDGMVKNAGNAPALMVLEAADPVPPGTPAGTVILRKE